MNIKFEIINGEMTVHCFSRMEHWDILQKVINSEYQHLTDRNGMYKAVQNRDKQELIRYKEALRPKKVRALTSKDFIN